MTPAGHAWASSGAPGLMMPRHAQAGGLGEPPELQPVEPEHPGWNFRLPPHTAHGRQLSGRFEAILLGIWLGESGFEASAFSKGRLFTASPWGAQKHTTIASSCSPKKERD